MIHRLSTAHDKPSTTTDRRTFLTNVVVGGSKSSILRDLLNSLEAETTIAIDNQVEIAALRAKYYHNNLTTFVTGEGLTTRKAYRLASSEIAAAGKSTNNSGMAEGFGGRGVNARLAIEELIRSANFQDCLESLCELARVSTNGAPGRFEINAYGSICGAAYAATVIPVTDAIVSRLVTLGVEVKVRYFALGPCTFAGLAKRGWPNAACAIVQHLVRMTDSSDPELDLATRELLLEELPPYQSDWYSRERLIRYDASAMRSKQMRSQFNLIQSNHNMDGKWGGVVSRQVDFFPGLRQEKEIAALVAQSLREELKVNLLSIEADPLLVKDLHWRDESEPVRRLPIDEILDQVEASTPEETCRQISQVEVRPVYRLFLETAEGTEFELEKLSEDFCSTPSDVRDYRYRLGLLAACNAKLQDERSWIDNDLIGIADEILGVEKEVQDLCNRIQSGSVLGVQRYEAPLLEAAEALRSLHDRRSVRIAERDAVDRAFAESADVKKQLDSRLKEIDASLDSFVPRGAVAKLRNLVKVSKLADIFLDLVAVPQLERWEQLDRLCSFATGVTPEGLAEILSKQSDRLDILADEIVRSEYPIASPHHGGKRRSHPSEVFYILPPMASAIESELRHLIQARNQRAMVVFCDSITCGATVMRMSLFRFKTVNEIFDGQLGHALKKALDDPLSPLNATDLLEGIRTLGGRIVGNQVVFDDAKSQGNSF